MPDFIMKRDPYVLYRGGYTAYAIYKIQADGTEVFVKDIQISIRSEAIDCFLMFVKDQQCLSQ